jgi:hypothetical protein
MKKVLFDVLIIVLTAIITSIGFTALLVAFKTRDGELYIFIPAMIISWIIFLPLYMYWRNLFKRIFKIDDDVKED